jgi:glycosyltransferase involved in cell wall biosynthesis
MTAPISVLCLSHLRWSFAAQRPHQLLSRCARDRPTVFFEEPVFDTSAPILELNHTDEGVLVAVPHLAPNMRRRQIEAVQRDMFDRVLMKLGDSRPVLWYYTPMALAWARHIPASAVVYDCMDELSAFAGAAEGLRRREVELIARADIVTTGGASLYEARRHRHGNVHLFPSSVDVPHFAQARRAQADPPDQATIARPRLGYFGVIDERMDLDLLAGLAAMRPHWQVVLVGPTAKIDEATLPRGANIHYLGRKPYDVLPAYLAGWDVALLPFARNEATRYISPTKTPEYLAAGRPVVSTSIRDVVRPYGERGVVRIADTVEDFVDAVEACLAAPDASRDTADGLLRGMSWDATWSRMRGLVAEACAAATPAAA